MWLSLRGPLFLIQGLYSRPWIIWTPLVTGKFPDVKISEIVRIKKIQLTHAQL